MRLRFRQTMEVQGSPETDHHGGTHHLCSPRHTLRPTDSREVERVSRAIPHWPLGSATSRKCLHTHHVALGTDGTHPE